ncbi:hypothetical protein [Tropicibacter oceani]|uniref:Uncharacterized protein n=1 Tax=Tropicibacter oceani TaxID=3058420 RepID=A0ABY8QDV5_9RHOB|nr:hypothetical protein [Tropicibacter oceani]WGW02387.1 hypothetical protein QF118_10530 [Tropicibacter oceani]
MFLELIAVFVAGFAGAGIMLMLSKGTGGRLPRWIVPVAAGLAMLAAAISNEYSWYGRTASSLPEGLVVAQTVENRAFWRPWTYVVPMTDRFVAVDKVNIQTNANDDRLFLTSLYFFGRWRPVKSVEVMIDCAGGRRADPTFGDGSPPVWRDVGADDPIVFSVCGKV